MSKKARCRFPVSRIKRIMQTDDDVGKIARDTPVLVSRGLELFIQQLISQSAQKAKEKGSSLLHPCHVKECVKGNEMWDFLEEIVASLPDTEPEPKKRQKKSDSPSKGKQEDGDVDDPDEEVEEDED